MLRKRNIVESTTPPSIDSLWLNKGIAKVFVNGEWITIAGGETPDQKELEEKVDNLDKEVGTIQKDVAVLNSKAIVELKIGNSESVKANNLAKLQAIQSVDHLFFAGIDYGYGAAKWLPTTGGEAFIVTSSGRAVIYNIGKDGSVAKASTDIDLTNPNTDLFEVVTELPTENISTSKLYCVLSSKVGEENKYTEYAYIKQTDGQFAWEKMGEFNATPDLSGYAKLHADNVFRCNNVFATGFTVQVDTLKVAGITESVAGYLFDKSDPVRTNHTTYTNDGKKADIGIEESFVFTLEDGSKVTKSIRVVSTTNS
jgi:hypothetical protein